ncbi:MAG: hypothetical protein OIF58_02890 [Cohaesibacter sp.]|nr:hypothetical protein [Cohaesibacter sp.]
MPLYGLDRFDWTLANKEARLVLYSFTKNLYDNGLINWNSFLAEAFKGQEAKYDGFLDGFRRGNAGSRKLALVTQQIARQFPDRSDLLIEQLKPVWPDRKSDHYWNDFLQAHAKFSNLAVQRETSNGLQIVKFSEQEPISNVQLKLGDEFRFKLDSPICGYCLALQNIGHAWFKLPLSPQSPVVPVTMGEQILPDYATAAPFSEEEDIGKHKFVLVVAGNSNLIEMITSNPIQNSEFRQLAQNLSNQESEWMIYAINVLFHK